MTKCRYCDEVLGKLVSLMGVYCKLFISNNLIVNTQILKTDADMIHIVMKMLILAKGVAFQYFQHFWDSGQYVCVGNQLGHLHVRSTLHD